MNTTNTDQSTEIKPRSRTLLRLEKSPPTVCATCPNAIWQHYKKASKPSVRVYCLTMHSLIDTEIMDCDGIPDEQEQTQPSAPATPAAEPIKDYGLLTAGEQPATTQEPGMKFL